jgi:hypothetical protein
MLQSLSLRYLLLTTLLIPIVCVFSPRAESATFFVTLCSKTVNHEFRVKFWVKYPKWRFVPKMGRGSDGWSALHSTKAPIFVNF